MSKKIKCLLVVLLVFSMPMGNTLCYAAEGKSNAEGQEQFLRDGNTFATYSYSGTANRSITIPVSRYNTSVTVSFDLYYTWTEGDYGKFTGAQKTGVSSIIRLTDYYISYTISSDIIIVKAYAVDANGDRYESGAYSYYVDGYGVVE